MTTSPLMTVSGTITIRERISIPPGAVATVKIVDGQGEVLAATAVEVTGVPAHWSVTIDQETVPDASRLQVWAALRTEAGWWGTLDLQPVAQGTDIVLTRVPD